MVLPAFLWAVTGAWPHSTAMQSDRGHAAGVRVEARDAQQQHAQLERGHAGQTNASLERERVVAPPVRAQRARAPSLRAQRVPVQRAQMRSPVPVRAAARLDTAAVAEQLLDATALHRAPALSVALFTGEGESLFPIDVHVELHDADGQPLLDRHIEATDGQRVSFDHVARTPEGERAFHVEAVARHHIGGVVELDWELEVHDAPFAGLDWEGYLLHRLNLGPRPGVQRAHLSAARADIVEVGDAPFVEAFAVGEAKFELRLSAHDLP